VQISEAQKHTNSSVAKFRRDVCQIENANSQVEFRWRSQKFEPQQKIMLESIDLMQQHNFDVLI
jgi:hypothetical protein